MPSLEDILIKIMEEERSGSETEHDYLDYDNKINLLSCTDSKKDFSLWEKFRSDFASCFRKRYLITLRDYKGFIIEILGPILLVLFGLILAQFKIKEETEKIRIFDLEFVLHNKNFN